MCTWLHKLHYIISSLQGTQEDGKELHCNMLIVPSVFRRKNQTSGGEGIYSGKLHKTVESMLRGEKYRCNIQVLRLFPLPWANMETRWGKWSGKARLCAEGRNDCKQASFSVFFFFLQILIRHACQLPTKSKRDQCRHTCDRTWNWVAIAIAAFAELHSDWAAHMGLMAQQTWTGCFRSQTATAPGCYLWGGCTKGGVSKAGAVLWFGYFFEMFACFQLSGELILRNLDFNLL